jgi:hypothetical protein
MQNLNVQLCHIFTEGETKKRRKKVARRLLVYGAGGGVATNLNFTFRTPAVGI